MKAIKLPVPTEAQVQRGIIDFLLRTGWSVWRVGQRDARRTQDPGVSDLIAMHWRYGIVFIEVKRPGGRQSEAQKTFETAVRAANGYYLLADSVEVVADWVKERQRYFTGARSA